MRKLTTNEIKKIEINILIEIDRICRINHINYSLCGGTLLGAVRHKGFIPWDDDIDITMSRHDYCKFIDCFNDCTNSNLKLIDYSCKNYGYMFLKVCDSQTRLIEQHNKHVENLGIFVDVFPVDYLGDNLDDSKKILKSFRFKKYLLSCWNWKNYYVNKDKSKSRQIARFIFYILSRFVSKKRVIESMNKKIKKLNKFKQYSGCLFGSYNEKDIIRSSMLNELIDIEFEGKSFMCFKDYDEYLKKMYGDYMSLPPKEKQITHHTFDAYID